MLIEAEETSGLVNLFAGDVRIPFEVGACASVHNDIVAATEFRERDFGVIVRRKGETLFAAVHVGLHRNVRIVLTVLSKTLHDCENLASGGIVAIVDFHYFVTT